MSSNSDHELARVVVTGHGVISSIGIGSSEFWSGLISGKSGISRITTFSTENMPSHYGGEVKNFDAGQYISKKNVSLFGRASQFASAAARLALADSGIRSNSEIKSRVGVVVGTTMGESQAIEAIDEAWVKSGEGEISARWINQYPGNSLAVNTAKELGINGITVVIPTACAAGNYAIGYGYDLIRNGEIDIAIVGGADAFSRIAYVGFNRMFAMAPLVCRPFDKDREGMLLGEGAGFLILESFNHAIKRGARIYSEIGGYALSCDASHMTIPNVEGVADVINKALVESGVMKNEVGYISAHGTGTKMNDKVECSALRKIFDSNLASIPVSSIKSMLGHAMGAASSLEAISCSLALHTGDLPPTINYNTPDEDCLIDCVPNISRKRQLNIALNNAFAFGGNNACLVLRSVRKA